MSDAESDGPNFSADSEDSDGPDFLSNSSSSDGDVARVAAPTAPSPERMASEIEDEEGEWPPAEEEDHVLVAEAAADLDLPLVAEEGGQDGHGPTTLRRLLSGAPTTQRTPAQQVAVSLLMHLGKLRKRFFGGASRARPT